MICALATAFYAAVCAPGPGPMDCNIDGRLKGVQIGSPLYERTIATFPGRRCVAHGVVFDAKGLRR
jgi:hypothetical protein